MVISSGRSKYWIPECDQQIKPQVGMMFKDLGEGLQFYKNYGSKSGFDVRISTTRRFKSRIIREQNIVCNREGFKNCSKSVVVEELESNGKKRRRVSNRVGCKARLVFEYAGITGYSIKIFYEQHNHFLSSSIHPSLLKVNRKLNFAHQKFILNCVRANVGPAKPFRLYKEMVRGHSNVGALQIDFKNFKRDLKAYICGADAQMVIDNFLKKLEVCPDLAFDYDVDNDEQLTRLFWADSTSRKNYAKFGDVVSFDATYNTNRYKMVFAPFTGVDNHKRCITFAAGLLLKEDVDSYVWLFKNFLKYMGEEPSYLITDQDPAMKIAFQMVFNKSQQRFCMWHIMEKVSGRVGPVLSKDENFMRKLKGIVWNSYIEPTEFDLKWKEIMNDFGLSTHTWFSNLFDIRDSWIPAFFRDVNMSGLLRTTSRSESANSWFGSFTNPQSSLVEFFMYFKSAMDEQRDKVRKLNNACETRVPDCTTPLAIEEHAASIYTTTVFMGVMSEIEAACYKCAVVNIREEVDRFHYTIKDVENGTFDVISYKDVSNAQCSCKMFERFGLLCRHIFLLFKDLENIPEKYILNRWMKAASLNLDLTGDALDEHTKSDDCSGKVDNLWADLYCCVGLAEANKDRLDEFSRVINEQKQLLLASREGEQNISSKQAVIESFIGSTSHLNVQVLPPKHVKNKGSGSRKKTRIEGEKEKSINASKKLKRRCGSCGEVGTHNSRTCSKKHELP